SEASMARWKIALLVVAYLALLVGIAAAKLAMN
ncbi:MAG: hypothetical protein QOJ15_1314, partial [Bradyrhizobium sp.]|nr:hypothetical protein [Bradyrhizobium sp.]